MSAFRTRAAVAGALLAPLAACATPGNTPSGTPTAKSVTLYASAAPVTLYASAAPVQPQRLPVPLPVERVPVDGIASCAWPAAPMPASSGSTAVGTTAWPVLTILINSLTWKMSSRARSRGDFP